MTSRYRSANSMMCSGEHEPSGVDGGGEPVDFLESVVKSEGRARSSGHVEKFHHRHGAVMTRADCDALFVHDRAEIVRMHAFDGEGYDAHFFFSRPDQPQAGNGGEFFRGVIMQRALV